MNTLSNNLSRYLVFCTSTPMYGTAQLPIRAGPRYVGESLISYCDVAQTHKPLTSLSFQLTASPTDHLMSCWALAPVGSCKLPTLHCLTWPMKHSHGSSSTNEAVPCFWFASKLKGFPKYLAQQIRDLGLALRYCPSRQARHQSP